MPEAKVTPQPLVSSYIPAMDGVRGIAILLVLLAHAYDLFESALQHPRLLKIICDYGWMGVDLFFALSGFLITRILLRTRASANYFQSFYARRMLRILPIYYLALAFALLVIPRLPGLNALLPAHPGTRASYVFFLQDIPFFRAQPWFDTNVIGHFWTLAVEEQFYLVWPLVLFLVAPRRLWLALSLFLAASAVGRFGSVAIWGDFDGSYLTLGRIDGILFGAALAIVTQRRLVPVSVIAAAALGSAVALAVIFRAAHSPNYPYIRTLSIPAIALLLTCFVALAMHPLPLVQHVLRFAPLRSFGKYSYGIYVYHPFLFLSLNVYMRQWFPAKYPFTSAGPALLYTAGLITVTYFIARVSYRVIEKRFLDWKRYFEPVSPPAAPVEQPQKVAAFSAAWRS